MHPEVDRYLNRVLAAADLAPRDERSVREELESHLAFLEDAAAARGLGDEEVREMLEKEFGDAGDVGADIAKAKGLFRTWLKKRARKVAITAAVAVAIALVVRWQVAEAFRMAGDSMAPVVPAGSLVIVNKWASLAPGDVVVFRDERDRNIIATADAFDGDTATMTKLNVPPESAAEWPKTLDRERVVGRIWLISR